MKTIRNMSFVVMVLTVMLTGPAILSAEDFCPDGCACGWGCIFQSTWRGSVFCNEVETCDDVYPNFCDDFETACYAFCWDHRGEGPGLPVSFGCGTISGACDADCDCGSAGQSCQVIED